MIESSVFGRRRHKIVHSTLGIMPRGTINRRERKQRIHNVIKYNVYPRDIHQSKGRLGTYRGKGNTAQPLSEGPTRLVDMVGAKFAVGERTDANMVPWRNRW